MFRVAGTRIFFQRSGIIFDEKLISSRSKKTQASVCDSKDIPDVKGLSEVVVKVPDTPVGFAGASKNSEYKNPEYFCYHVDSFGDSMVELEKYRLPPPSNKAKK